MAGPTKEIGGVNNVSPISGVAGWGTFIDEAEYVPELQWPNFIGVYDRMGSDGQVAGLKRSVELPILARPWAIDPNGADPASVERLAQELRLPIIGQKQGPQGRRRNRFSFKRHLQDCLRALWYGHYFFEQVGERQADKWVLRKLAPRPPRTISDIKVAPDGGLEYIQQSLGATNQKIKVSNLVAYVWDQEAGNWTGKSMLRACYKSWVIKDKLVRIDALKHQRTGIGMPVIEAPQGASQRQIQELHEIAQNFKATDAGGAAVPHGSKLSLVGTTGTVPDTWGSIRGHNEEMAGSFLAMFKQLGTTETGSRALGSTFVDFFSLALDAVQDWVIDIFNAHVIEDWYDWNYGEDSQCAILVVDEDSMPDPEQEIRPLRERVENEEIQVDEETEEEIGASVASARKRRRAARGRGLRAESSESASLLPPRDLRRQPYEHEIVAAVDYATMDADLDKFISLASQEILKLQKQQIDELHQAIIDADGDLGKLAKLRATPVAEAAILKAMEGAGQMGIDTAANEAAAQGVAQKAKPKLSGLVQNFKARAAATDAFLAGALSQSAIRNALRVTGAQVDPKMVADTVRDQLLGLSDSFIKDQLNGAVTQAMNDGRRETMRSREPSSLYASELLDTNTCDACRAIDGTEYESVDASIEDYPTGGYIGCAGMERCRGTIVAVYGEISPEDI